MLNDKHMLKSTVWDLHASQPGQDTPSIAHQVLGGHEAGNCASHSLPLPASIDILTPSPAR